MKPTIAEIINAVALGFGLTAQDLTGYSRKPATVHARYIAYHAMRRAGVEIQSIAAAFNRNAQSVRFGLKRAAITLAENGHTYARKSA